MTDDRRGGYRGTNVRLRALERGDLEDLRAMVNDPEVMRFSNSYRPISDVEQAAWLEGVVKNGSAVWFGIEDARRGASRLVGTCCLVDIDPIGRKAELRVRLGDPDSWGGGLGTEACALLVQHGFLEVNLERIWLRVFDHNMRALRLYEKLGFVVEGRLRRHDWVGGDRRDTVILGLLREEWRGAQPKAAKKRKA
ncbi:MAG: GNAT family N-acetyltransferase [Deltaproteobacteria bacterium]|nr:GNAT family N-acetyltransferase [Deltaproteobacteria bacterium]